MCAEKGGKPSLGTEGSSSPVFAAIYLLVRLLFTRVSELCCFFFLLSAHCVRGLVVPLLGRGVALRVRAPFGFGVGQGGGAIQVGLGVGESGGGGGGGSDAHSLAPLASPLWALAPLLAPL